MSQLAIVVNCLEAKKGRLLVQPKLNPKNVSAMTLKSGKEIEGPKVVIPKDKSEDQIEKEIEDEGRSDAELKVISNPVIQVKSNPPPFPNRLEKPKKQDKEKEILKLFCKVEISMPLLSAIKQVSKYAKFLKDLCGNKRKVRGEKRIVVGESVSALLQRNLPSKCGDLGMFTIP